MSSPTQRSLKYLRSQGGIVDVCERYIAAIRQRKDLFGFGDLVHVQGDFVTLIQTTSRSNMNARVKKIKEECPMAKQWLASPMRKIVVHGWAKRGARGKRKMWQLDTIEIQPSEVL